MSAHTSPRVLLDASQSLGDCDCDIVVVVEGHADRRADCPSNQLPPNKMSNASTAPEVYGFQAEISQLMDLIIHTFYQYEPKQKKRC